MWTRPLWLKIAVNVLDSFTQNAETHATAVLCLLSKELCQIQSYKRSVFLSKEVRSKTQTQP